jgi:chromosome segregation ATPase
MIDWTTVLVAALTGLMGGAAITAVWKGLEARAQSKRSDEKIHVEAADAISETSVEMLQRTVEQYEKRLSRSDERLVTLEEKCHRYEMAFESMREDLIQARQTITRLELANSELRRRVKHLEEENADLRRRLDAVKQRMDEEPK